MDQELFQKLENCQTLPSLPAIAYQVIEQAKSNNSNSALVADILEKDPALAAKVVALANSAANMSVRQIDSVQDAITRIGLDMTMTLALSFSFAKAMYDAQLNSMDHATFWKRSLLSGVAGKVLAEYLKLKKPDQFFLAGLVQDIGMLALNEVESERYGVIFHSAANHEALFEFERSEFHTNHAQVGSWLLERWGMPDLYCDLIRNSHRQCAPESPAEHKVMHFSGLFAELWVHQSDKDAMNQLVCEGRRCKTLKPEAIRELSDQIAQQLPVLNDIFETDIKTEFSATAMVEEAKQQLAARNLQLMQELAQAKKEVAQAKASQEELQDQLKKDILTGVFNRAYIENISERAFKKSAETIKPLTIMFLDIDHFKQVNDRYGHQSGDLALKHFARVLVKAAGKNAYVGRYGGEEFAIVMPGVTTDVATTIAAKIRTLLRKHTLNISGSTQLTIRTSIGIATYIPRQKDFASAESLLDAADKTMYQAKAGGRDKAMVFGAC